MTLLITGATLPDGTRSDLLVADGVVAERGTGLSALGATVIDAAGLRALPGLVDLHTHLREPGFEQSETVLTGTRAAAAGGYTAVHAMANTLPVSDSPEVVERVAALGAASGYATVRPVGAVTVGLAGERLADLQGMAHSAAAVTVFSDDGRCVVDGTLMRAALGRVAALGGVVAQHAQDDLAAAGQADSAVADRIGVPEWPGVGEATIIARDALLARDTGARLHVCHVSVAESVEVVRWAKAQGIAITAEVTPHHLLLDEELAALGDPRFKVNPPLRTADDVQAVRRALAEGIIDVVATDHAPHPAASKQKPWSQASFGMVGLESALSVVHRAMVDTGLLGWADVARVMSMKPAAIGRLSSYQHPFEVGSPAHLALYDPSVVRVFDAGRLRGMSQNSPFLGMELPGRIVATIHRGIPTVLDGELRSEEEIRGLSA